MKKTTVVVGAWSVLAGLVACGGSASTASPQHGGAGATNNEAGAASDGRSGAAGDGSPAAAGNASATTGGNGTSGAANGGAAAASGSEAAGTNSSGASGATSSEAGATSSEAGATSSEAGAGGSGAPSGPAAQGAFIATAQSGLPGKTCPSGASLTFDVPHVDPLANAGHVLDGDTYVDHVTNGENGAVVRCSVRGSSSFTFDGRIQAGPGSSLGEALEISEGMLGANKKGTARIALSKANTPGFSHALSSPPPSPCTIDAAALPSNALQVKAGAMWAHYSCPQLVAEPSDGCSAEGYFVLENCVQ